MPRPPKKRMIKNIPEVKFFKPAGIPMRELSEINLSLEEVEAIRLKDVKNLTQEEAAKKMEVSRPTYQRILVSAREKIAQALIKGKAIRFQGGDYHLVRGTYRCLNCDHIFKLPGRRARRGRGRGRGRGNWIQNKNICPNCGETSVSYLNENEQD